MKPADFYGLAVSPGIAGILIIIFVDSTSYKYNFFPRAWVWNLQKFNLEIFVKH